MNLINKWLTIFTRPKFLSESKYRIEEAFVSGGRTYYQFADPNQVPYRRGLTSLDYYEELRQRCTREYLIQHTEAVARLLSDPKKIDIGALALIERNLADRLKWIINPDLVYKLASVVFFDGTENPKLYDRAYGLRKIERWKKEMTIRDFFFSQPLIRLLPYLREFDGDIEDYSQQLTLINKYHELALSSIISSGRLMTESELLSQLRGSSHSN